MPHSPQNTLSLMLSSLYKASPMPDYPACLLVASHPLSPFILNSHSFKILYFSRKYLYYCYLQPVLSLSLSLSPHLGMHAKISRISMLRWSYLQLKFEPQNQKDCGIDGHAPPGSRQDNAI
ncbi:hypothetical protein NMG60_11015131 [Bertholletia excelsa]